MYQAVERVIKTTPQMRSADRMSKEELGDVAKRAAGGLKRLRELFPDVLSKRILSLVATTADEELLDVLTAAFPCSSKKAKSFSNIEFEKMVRAVVHQLYVQNKLMPKEQRPRLLQHKTFLNVRSFDALDEALLGATRLSIQDGRSDARKTFYRLFAIYLMLVGARMELVSPTAAAPAPGAGPGSAFYEVEVTWRVTESGVVPADDPTVQEVARRICLYYVAREFLQALAMYPFVFDAAVVDPVAKNLRRIALSDDRSWCQPKSADAESQLEKGDWALLLPMVDTRLVIDKEVQSITPQDRLSMPESATFGEASVRGGFLVALTDLRWMRAPPVRQTICRIIFGRRVGKQSKQQR